MRTPAARLRRTGRLCRGPEDEGDLLLAAVVSEPVPAVHALAGDEEPVAEGGDGAEKGFGRGRQVACEDDPAVLVEDDEEQGPACRSTPA
jgi:hypothetical protein